MEMKTNFPLYSFRQIYISYFHFKNMTVMVKILVTLFGVNLYILTE